MGAIEFSFGVGCVFVPEFHGGRNEFHSIRKSESFVEEAVSKRMI